MNHYEEDPVEIRLIVYKNYMEVDSPYHKGLVNDLRGLREGCSEWKPGIVCSRWDQERKRWIVGKHHRRDVEAICRKHSLYFGVTLA